jgi:4-diphosphocytidyl-2-C-methyl-D-erythritol kinase
VRDDLTEPAPAKVNLFLHVLGRRSDGYHLLDSLAVFADVGDTLRVDPAEELSLAVAGPFAKDLSANSDNLVLRAAGALAAEFAVAQGARLSLAKHLPVASGIGGGSADAAAALRLLCRLWRISPDSGRLAQLAGGLGADVPACLARLPVRMGGIGERLEPGPALPACGIVLVNPGVALATADVFRTRDDTWSARAALPASWSRADTMAADLKRLRNDLQPAALSLCPVIGGVLTALEAAPGCLLARMSGSGATCFGLFADEAAARRAAVSLERAGWWCWGGGLRRDQAGFTPVGPRPIHPEPDGA